MLNIATFRERVKKIDTADKNTAEYVVDRVNNLFSTLRPTEPKAWSRYTNFWPPTVLKALRERRLCFFMGAGTSAAAKLPTWREMLEQRFGVPAVFLSDENLKNDNLTLGEIAGRLIGREQLQSNLRSIYNDDSAQPTCIHYCLAALDLPVYMTTNYDVLFERAWQKIYSRKIAVVCNSSDLSEHTGAPNKLFKLHGCASKGNELLVLTRSEYRQHYRSNNEVFENVRKYLRENPTVFMGFSHTDPEVGRMIDDIIFHYEREVQAERKVSAPDIYNLQFENTYVANERFAAKGLVSLSVRLADKVGVDARTAGISVSLAELVDATASGMDEVTSVDADLAQLVEAVKCDLDKAITELQKGAKAAARQVVGSSIDKAHAQSILDSIDIGVALGTQGLYLLDANGELIAFRLLPGMDEAARKRKLDEIGNNLGERRYFQTSKSFKQAFVSDIFGSIFNDQATFAICVPITNGQIFDGLLFSACQIGQWQTPIQAAGNVGKGLAAYILDGQGMVAIPPNAEFEAEISSKLPSEPERYRRGYNYLELKILSKKDRIINRLAENIVPVEKDDDVVSLHKDIDIYARIQNIGNLGWRCAVSRPIKFTE